MTVSPDDPRSAYVQVADDLRRQIETGALKASQKLDTNAKLAERYGVAAMTVRHALDVLRKEGLIVSQQGRGTFVGRTPTQAEPAVDANAGIVEIVTALQSELRELAARVAELEERADHTGCA